MAQHVQQRGFTHHLVAVRIAGAHDRHIGKLGIAEQHIGACEQRDDHLEIGE
ncbi:MAG: hypothetical protein WAM77_27310 [Xanthobacteraceae bacterium]